jgi:hypothetical protein
MSDLVYAHDDFVFFDKDNEVGVLHLKNGQELGTYPHVGGEVCAIQSYKDRVIVGFSNSELVCYSILCKLVMWQLKLQPGAKEGEGGFVDLILYSPSAQGLHSESFNQQHEAIERTMSTSSMNATTTSTSTSIPLKQDIIVAFTRRTIFGVNPISGEIKFKINPTDTLGLASAPSSSSGGIGGAGGKDHRSNSMRKTNSTTTFLHANNMKIHSESIYQVKIQKNKIIVICGISEDQEYSKFYPTSVSVFLMNRLRLRLNLKKRKRSKIPELDAVNRIDLEARVGCISCVGIHEMFLYLADEISLHRFRLQGFPEMKSLVVEEGDHVNNMTSTSSSSSSFYSSAATALAATESHGMNGSNINLNAIIDSFTGAGNGQQAANRDRRSPVNVSNTNTNTTTSLSYQNMITCLEVDPNFIVVGMQNNMLYCFDRESLKLLWKKKHRVNHLNTNYPVNNLGTTTTANNITAAANTVTATVVHQEEPKKGISSIRIHASQGIVLTSSLNDHMIRSWKLRDHGREAFFLNSHVLGCGVSSLQVLPHESGHDVANDRLLSIGKDKFVRYWDIPQNTQLWATYTSGIEVFAVEYFRDYLYLGVNSLQGQGVGVATRNGFGNKRRNNNHNGGNESNGGDEEENLPHQNDSAEGYEIQKWAVNHELARNQLMWFRKLPHNKSRPVSFAFTSQLVFVGTSTGRFYAIYEDSGIIAFNVIPSNESVVRMLATESIIVSISKKGDIPTLIDGWDIETHTVSASDFDNGNNCTNGSNNNNNNPTTLRNSFKRGTSVNVNSHLNIADPVNGVQLLARCDHQLWRNHIPNYEQFAALTENDKLLVVSDTNDVIMIDLLKGYTLAEVNCHSRITCLKTMEENHLLVGLTDGNIYSIGGKTDASLFSVMGHQASPSMMLTDDLESNTNATTNTLPVEMYNVKRMFADYLHPTKYMIFMNVMTSSSPSTATSVAATSSSGMGGMSGNVDHGLIGLHSPSNSYSSPFRSPSSRHAPSSSSSHNGHQRLLILCSNNLVRCCRYDEFGGGMASSMMMNNNSTPSTTGFLWHTIVDPTQPLDADVIRYAFSFRDDTIIIVKGNTVMGLNALDGSIVFEMKDEHGHPIHQALIVTGNFLCTSTGKELRVHDLTMLSYWAVPCCVFDLANDLMEIREGRRGKLLDVSNTLGCACCSSNLQQHIHHHGTHHRLIAPVMTHPGMTSASSVSLSGTGTGSGTAYTSSNPSSLYLADEENCCCSCQCSHTISGSCSSPLFGRTMTVLATYRNMIALLLQMIFFLVETMQLFSFAFSSVEKKILPDYARFQIVLQGFQKLLSKSSASYDYDYHSHSINGRVYETDEGYAISFEIYVYICWGIMIIFVLCFVFYEWLAWRAFKAPTSMYPKWTAIAGCCTDIITGPLLIPIMSTSLSTAYCIHQDIYHGRLHEEHEILCSSSRHIALIIPTLLIFALFFMATFRLKRVKNRMDAIQMNLFDIRRVQVRVEY